MKEKVRFVLKNPKAKSSTAIYMIYAWGYKGINNEGREAYIPLKYATRKSIDPDKWDKDEQRADDKYPYAANINNELDIIKVKADKIYIDLKDKGLTPELFRTELDIALGRVEANTVPKVKKQFIDTYIDRYIKDIESGVRRTFNDATRRFSPGTIRNFKAFRTKFKEYEAASGKQYTFDDINMKFYRHFVAWLGMSHTINSTGKTIKQLKMIMQAAFDDDVHKNLDFKKKGFKVVSELVNTIYLNEQEIEKLYKYDAKGPYEKARDLFMIGVLTAQRVSDWNKIGRENIKTTSKKIKIIKIRQQKTGATVIIPFTNPWLVAILEKYDYQLPKMPEQKINEYIKTVCMDAGIKDKANKVTTHTARRSACTNMYNAGIPIGKIMKLSGHKTESEFKKYIRITDEENAEDLATHEYFTRQNK